MAVHASDPSIWEMKAGESQLQGRLRRCSQLKPGIHEALCQKQNKTKKHKEIIKIKTYWSTNKMLTLTIS